MHIAQIAFWSIIGYVIDIILNIVVVRFLLRTGASVSSIAFFEWIHDTVTFLCGFFLGLSIMSISLNSILETLVFTGGWTAATFFMARYILGFDSVKKTLAFLGLDTAFDYGLGGLIAVPAGLTLFSVVPVSTATSAAAKASPLSLRPVIVATGLVLLLVIVGFQKVRGIDVEIITEEN